LRFRERALSKDGRRGIDVSRLWPEHKPWIEDPPPGPLWSRDHYRRFLDAVLAYPPERVESITTWIRDHDETKVQGQFPEHQPGSGVRYPISTGTSPKPTCAMCSPACLSVPAKASSTLATQVPPSGGCG
jgi:hypothetical protein